MYEVPFLQFSVVVHFSSNAQLILATLKYECSLNEERSPVTCVLDSVSFPNCTK